LEGEFGHLFRELIHLGSHGRMRPSIISVPIHEFPLSHLFG
jgi:hypothetical protein